MSNREHPSIWQRWHIDLPLFAGLLVLIIVGLLTLYSADGQDLELIKGQALKLLFATVVMLLVEITRHPFLEVLGLAYIDDCSLLVEELVDARIIGEQRNNGSNLLGYFKCGHGLSALGFKNPFAQVIVFPETLNSGIP